MVLSLRFRKVNVCSHLAYKTIALPPSDNFPKQTPYAAASHKGNDMKITHLGNIIECQENYILKNDVHDIMAYKTIIL